eukprot:s47_g22.t1
MGKLVEIQAKLKKPASIEFFFSSMKVALLNEQVETGDLSLKKLLGGGGGSGGKVGLLDVLRRGDAVCGSFFINRPFDGSLLVQNTCAEWRLGEDEGLYEKQGENNEPLRPDGGAFVPRCVGDALLKVDWMELRHGALVEVRLRYGPELKDVAPQYAKQFEQATKDARKKGRKGGAMVSILVQIFPPNYRPSASDLPEDGGTIIDESIPKDRPGSRDFGTAVNDMIFSIDTATSEANDAYQVCTQLMRKNDAMKGTDPDLKELKEQNSRLMQRMAACSMIKDTAIKSSGSIKTEALKKAKAKVQLDKNLALFSKYDSNKDGVLEKKEISALAKKEYSFTMPDSALSSIVKALVEDGAKGVKREKFQSLKIQIGIARERAKDLQRRKRREAHEKEIENVKDGLRTQVEEVSQRVKEAEESVAKVEEDGRPLHAKGKDMKAVQMQSFADEIDLQLKEVKELVENIKKDLAKVKEVDSEVAAWLLNEVRPVEMRHSKLEPRLTMLSTACSRFRETMKSKDRAELLAVEQTATDILRHHLKRNSLRSDELCATLCDLEEGQATSEASFLKFFETAKDPEAENGENGETALKEDELKRLFKHWDEEAEGSVSRETLLSHIRKLMKVVKTAALTDGLSIKDSKSIRRLSEGEVVEALGVEEKDEDADLVRLKVKAHFRVCPAFRTRHNVEPKQKASTYWAQEWGDNWQSWEDSSAAQRQPTQSPRGRQPNRQPSPRSRKGHAKGKSKGKSTEGKAAAHPFGQDGSVALPPWPTWDVTEAGISPFQSTSQSKGTNVVPTSGSTLQEMAGKLRLAYKDSDHIPEDVQELLDRADKEANRSNIMSLHQATQTLDHAQIALQEATTAKKEHRLHWTKHVSEGIKIWEAQLESYRVHQAALSEKAATARAEINAARRAIQDLSDSSVRKGNLAIPQPIPAEAESSHSDAVLEAEEQKLRTQLQGVLSACAGSLGVSVTSPDDKGVQEISEDEKEHQSKRPRCSCETQPQTDTSNPSSSDCSPSQQYDNWPVWVHDLFGVHFGDVNAEADNYVEPISVLTWYIDHETDRICSNPKLVFLDFYQPEQWFEDAKFPWLHDIPFGERVFIDVIHPAPPRSDLETHVAELILTTRPVMISALIALQLHENPLPSSQIVQLVRVAAAVHPIETLGHLSEEVPQIRHFVEQGCLLVADAFPTIAQPVAVHNGQGFLVQVMPDDSELTESDENALLGLTEALIKPDHLQPFQDFECQSFLEEHQAHDGMHEATNVLQDLTNLPCNENKPCSRLLDVKERAPLSLQAVSSSPIFHHSAYDPDAVDVVSHMQFSRAVSCKNSPFTDQEDTLMQAFRDGHAQPQENVADEEDFELEPDSSGYDPSVASSDQPRTPEEDLTRQDVFLYHLYDDPIRANLIWTDYGLMIEEIARHFQVPRDRIIDAHEVAVTLPDLPEATSAAIVHMMPDLPPGHMMCLVLFDIAFHGHKSERHHKVGPAIDRQVIPTPRRATRHTILVLAQVEQYCDMEGGRCLVHLNHNRWPDYDDSIRLISSGDYIKISVPPSENYICATERLVRLVQDGNSHHEILDHVLVDEVTGGYSPDMLSEAEVRALRSTDIVDDDDTMQALQVSSSPLKPHVLQAADSFVPNRCSLTDEFLEAVSAARQVADQEIVAEEDEATAPSVFVQELDELWHAAAEQGHIQMDQRVRVESWFTDHMRHTRCHNSRITLLSSDSSAWERQLLDTWSDRAMDGVETDFAIVYPPTEDIAVNVIAQVVIVQRPQLDHRSLIITVYDSDPELEQPHTFALVLYERIGLEYVLEDLRLTHDCPPIRPQNECTLWFGSYPIRDGQLVHLRHGNALRLYVRRGIPVDLSALHLMSDSRLRQVLQDAIWGEIYVRPPRPVPPGESSSLRASSFVSQSVSDIARASADEGHSDSRPQWIQDLQDLFDCHAFIERADEGPVMYVLVWYLHGLNRERSGSPQTVRLGRIPFEWRTDLVFAWRDHIERAIPIDFHVVRSEPPSQPWQSISAHIILSQSLQSEQTALVISTITPAAEVNAIQHIACVLPGHITPSDIHSVGVSAPLRARAYTVSRGNRLIHQGQQLLVQTGECMTIVLARYDPPPVPVARDPVTDLDETPDHDDTVLMQTPPQGGGRNPAPVQDHAEQYAQGCTVHRPSVLNAEAPVFVSNPDSLPTWTASINDLYQVWQSVASSWEGELRSARFLSWFVAPATGRVHCWFSRKVALFVDFWNWKQTLGIRWRDELDLTVDFDIHFVKNPPAQMEVGIAGHIILVQHASPDQVAVLTSVQDPAIIDGHPYKTVHVLPEKVVVQEVFHTIGYGHDCVQNAICSLKYNQLWMHSQDLVAFAQADACEIIVQRRGVPSGWSPHFTPDPPGAEGLSMLQVHASRKSVPSSNHGEAELHVRSEGDAIDGQVPVSLALLLGEYVDDIAQTPFSLAQVLRPADGRPCNVVVCAWEIANGLTQTELIAADQFDLAEAQRVFRSSHGLLLSCSVLFSVNFVRDEWGFHEHQWHVGSYVCPPSGKVIVAVVEYYDDGATYRTVTLNKRLHVLTLKSALFAKHGSLMRLNGRLIHDEIDLEHGDVIELHASVLSPRISIHPGRNKVQVCLSACLPGPSIPFDEDVQAFDILPDRNIKKLLETSDDWSFDFIPEGVDLHPTTFEALHMQADIDATQAVRLELYIDGATSYDVSAWSVVAVYVSDIGQRLCGCLAGCTEVQQLSDQWIGASKHSNVEAETSAMAIATAFSLYAAQDIPVVIRPDLALSRQFLELQSASHQDTLVAKLLFLLGQMLPKEVTVTEVRAHTGDPWNELADAVAKWAARSRDSVGQVPWTLLHGMVAQTESLQWEWLRHVPASFTSAMPRLYDDSVWQPVPSNAHVGTEVVREKLVEGHIQIDLKVASYNALALNDEQREFGTPGVRSVRLDHQFHENRLVFVGIQEARTQEGVRVTDHYRILSSGFQQCGNTVHYGCELWIHKSLPIATRADGSLVKASDCNVTLQRVDSRVIVASLEGPVSLRIVVGHAPCLTSDRSIQEISGWWNALLSDVRDCPDTVCMLAFLDANAPLADEETRYYGMCAAEDINPAGTAFQDFLTQGRLYAPSTLGFHTGPQATWRHPRGNSYRRDYVLANEASMTMVQRSSVISQFDGGFGHADHVPVMLELQGLIAQRSVQQRYRWDYAKMHSADAKIEFQKALRTMPTPVWQTSVDDHSTLLESNILQLAQQHFGAPVRRPDRPVLKESTCNGIMLKRQALDMLRRADFDDPVLKQEIKVLESILRPMILHDQQAWWQCNLCEQSFDTKQALADTVEIADAEDAVHAKTLKSQGWLPTKAFLPAVRVPLPLLPDADTPEAALMRQRWNARVRMPGDAFEGLDGFCAHDASELASEDASEIEIIPFVMHTNGGKDQGMAGVFQQYGLAAEAARLHVTCLLFIHCYSGFRRDGDLQHCIEHQSTVDGVHLFCISIDLCLAKKHSDLTDENTKKFWIGKMKQGQIIGVGGGPSCETWSAARYCPPGPGPVRSHKHPWGIEGLTRRQWRQVSIGTVLITFLVDLLWEATILGLCGFLEHPQFPVWLMRVAPASIWSLKAITALSKLACYQICSFDQCVFGLPARKPTTLMLLRLSTFKDLAIIRGDRGRCNHHQAHSPLQGIQADGQFRTAKAKIYPKAMNCSIALAVSRFLAERRINAFCPTLPRDLQELESHEITDINIAMTDGAEGWVSVSGNQGTLFLKDGGHLFKVDSRRLVPDADADVQARGELEALTSEEKIALEAAPVDKVQVQLKRVEAEAEMVSGAAESQRNSLAATAGSMWSQLQHQQAMLAPSVPVAPLQMSYSVSGPSYQSVLTQTVGPAAMDVVLPPGRPDYGRQVAKLELPPANVFGRQAQVVARQRLDAPYMGCGGCGGCEYVQAAPYMEYAPPYPVLMGRLEPMYGIAQQPCVLSTQPTVPSLLPAPPVTYGWQAPPAAYVMPPVPAMPTIIAEPPQVQVLQLAPAEAKSSEERSSRHQLLLDDFLKPDEDSAPRRKAMDAGDARNEEYVHKNSKKVLTPGLVMADSSEEVKSPRWRDAESVANLFSDDKTTVMMRNIPNRYTCEELLSEVMMAGFDEAFDFFYLPMDFKTKRNRGYGFINFHTADIAKDFAMAFHRRQLSLYSSKKIVEVAPAVTQGYTANMTKYFEKDSERIKNDAQIRGFVDWEIWESDALQRNVQRMQRAIPRQRGEEVPSRPDSPRSGGSSPSRHGSPPKGAYHKVKLEIEAAVSVTGGTGTTQELAVVKASDIPDAAILATLTGNPPTGCDAIGFRPMDRKDAQAWAAISKTRLHVAVNWEGILGKVCIGHLQLHLQFSSQQVWQRPADKVVKETILTESFALDGQSAKEATRRLRDEPRKLKTNELVQVRSWMKKEEKSGLMRMKCRAISDGAIGLCDDILRHRAPGMLKLFFLATAAAGHKLALLPAQNEVSRTAALLQDASIEPSADADDGQTSNFQSILRQLTNAVASINSPSVTPVSSPATSAVESEKSTKKPEVFSLKGPSSATEAPSHPLMGSVQPSPIPRRLLFNHKFNLLRASDASLDKQSKLLRDNVRHIVKLFPDIGPSDESEALGLDFAREKVGMVKSDLCRLVMMYSFGGFYFDTDILPLPNLEQHLEPKATFATVIADDGKNYFQAFLAATPKHPAVLESLKEFKKWYDQLNRPGQNKDLLRRRTANGNIGTALLRKAFHTWSRGAREDSVVVHTGGLAGHVSQFFVEKNDQRLKGFQGLPSRLSGKLCNYAVVDRSSKTVVMFSRIYDKVHHQLCREEVQFMHSLIQLHSHS